MAGYYSLMFLIAKLARKYPIMKRKVLLMLQAVIFTLVLTVVNRKRVQIKKSNGKRLLAFTVMVYLLMMIRYLVFFQFGSQNFDVTLVPRDKDYGFIVMIND